MMVLCLAACGSDKTPSSGEGGTPGVSQSGDTNEGQGTSQTVGQGEESTDGGSESDPDITSTPDDGRSEGYADASVPITGLPIGWPDNDYTKLVPTPDCGGKVISANEIGDLFAIDLEWEMAQGLSYAQLLQDAGFGEDCVEKYEKNGYIDRTFNGVNVQLLDLFGTTTLSIMPVETE